MHSANNDGHFDAKYMGVEATVRGLQGYNFLPFLLYLSQ